MERAREQLNNPLVVGIGSFVIGLFIGLVVLGWWIWPVQYYDADPSNLRPDIQEDYLRMAIDSYTLTKDPVSAQSRWAALGDSSDEALAAVQANPGLQKPEDILAYMTVVQAAPVAGGTPIPGTPVPGAVATPTAKPSGSLVRTILPIMCIVTVLLAGALVVAFFLRSRRGPGAPPSGGSPQDVAQEAGWTDYATTGEEAPMAQFMATYKLGDDLFDDSFSIDSPAGEFLGECGVGISETIGVGDPKKVTAFEIWLFDKNDIQTVTKVLMSAHAFMDDTIRQRLEAKGEPIQANPGGQVVLETAALQLVARVVDMSYGEGALPPESFFDSLILELAVWPK
jgi:hypothetical protein